jgi:hypothetical protein
MDPLNPAWRERLSLTDVLLTADPPAVVVRQLLRFLEVVYNMQVFRLSTQGMLSIVLMDSTTMRDILILDLQYERQLSSSRRSLRFKTSVSSGTRSVPSSQSEGPIRRTREGGSEWEPIKFLLEGDGNSNKMNTASNARLRLTTKVGQAHVATGVPLDLGTNTPPSDPRNPAEKPNLEPTDPHRSDR